MHADNCVGCINFGINYEADWSEVTPGDGFSVWCTENRFARIQNRELTENSFRLAITTARTCGIFELKEEYK